MQANRVRAGIWWTGARDPHRTVFDALIPLSHGTSYNAWLVQGSEASAIIDTVEPAFADEFLARVASVDPGNIRYIVSNHSEQDHSGTLPVALERWPEAQILTTPRGVKTLLAHMDLPEDRIRTVEDGSTISLGNRSLHFLHAMWVHWPETMLTWLPEDRILFSCDLFGSHVGGEELLASACPEANEEARRYFAGIMMPFSNFIAKHLVRVGKLPIEAIAPSHGPLWDRPADILEPYRQWILDPPASKVIIAYVSMHGSTRIMANALAGRLQDRGLAVALFDLEGSDMGDIMSALVDTRTLVIGAPVVLAEAHPVATYFATVVNLLKPRLENLAFVGSYAWGGRATEGLTAQFTRIKVHVLEPVMARGLPREEDLAALDRLADEIATRHQTPQELK